MVGPDTLDDEENWGRLCACGHRLGAHTHAGVCVDCDDCKQERPRPQVRLAGYPVDFLPVVR